MTSIKFLHIADVHLGKRQYNSQDRYEDYFRAFKWILDYSIEQKVDFILIAGDLFDSRKIGPAVLTKVFNILRNFKKKTQQILNTEIPIICIEGNHDNPIYSRQTWMTFLADLDLIILLSGTFNRNTKEVLFEPHDIKNHRGGMIKIKNINIYGLPFYGSSTSHLFPPIAEAIKINNNTFNILMMHFGIEGEDPTKPGIDLSQHISTLKEKIDYLALGHYHKQYIRPSGDPWVFNPGSLEINDVQEVFKNYKRGVFLITCDGKNFKYKTIECEKGNSNEGLIPNRRFLSFSNIDISDSTSFEDVIDTVLDVLKKRGLPLKDSKFALEKEDLNCPIVLFSLKGEISYSRLEVNINKLRKEISEKFSVLDIRIFSPFLYSTLDDVIITEEKKSLKEIENEIFHLLVQENPQFKPISEEIVELMKTLKSDLLVGKPNYPAIKDMIKNMVMLNADVFKIPIKIREEGELQTESDVVGEKIDLSSSPDDEDDLDMDLDEMIDGIEE